MSSMENASNPNMEPTTMEETKLVEENIRTIETNLLSSPSATTPLIDTESENTFKEQASSVIKQIDSLVEKLRMEALNLEAKKESLLSMLESLKHSKDIKQLSEEESTNLREMIHDVRDRLATIEIHITTKRTKHQEEALHRVNVCIDALILKLQKDPIHSETTCRTFIRSCLSGKEQSELHEEIFFRSAVNECAMEDQNQIWRRLQGLLNYIENWQKSLGLELLD